MGEKGETFPNEIYLINKWENKGFFQLSKVDIN